MKTKTNFCGIFATVFILTTTVIIASCSQDDDYYDSNMYTLAEKMETRSGEGGMPLKILAGVDTFRYHEYFPVILEEIISWPEGYFGIGIPEPTPTLKVDFLDDVYIDLINHKMYEILSTQANWLGGSAVKGDIRIRIRNSENHNLIKDTTIVVIETVNIETE